MPLPGNATKVYLDQGTDDPKQARAELATLIDLYNALVAHLALSTITSTPLTVGEALEAAAGALQVKLDGATLLRSAAGLKLANVAIANGGTGATTAAQARTNLGLLSAAVKDAGTLAGQVLLLAVNNQLPALDGSLLTNLSTKFVDVKRYQTGAYGSTTNAIPYDNTKPRFDEGAEFMSFAYTPASAANKLIIDVLFNWDSNEDTGLVLSLLKDSDVECLASVADDNYDVSERSYPTPLTHEMNPVGTASPITFKVRAGRIGSSGANTVYFNGAGGAQKLGGSIPSSITVWEFKP